MINIKRLMATCLCVLSLLQLTSCKTEEAFDWSMLTVEQSATPLAPVQEGDSSPITVSMPLNSGEFNPAVNPSRQMQGIFTLVYEGVMRLDDRYKPEAWLAESYKKTPTGWIFTLRGNVIFQNGEPLRAEDVVRSFEAIQQAEDGPYAYILPYITSMEATADRELTVTSPYGYEMLYAMCFPVWHESAQEPQPLGTGPYFVDQYTPNTVLNLTRNTNWWRTPPKIPAITAVPVEQQTAEMVEIGQIDVASVNLLTVSSLFAHSRVGMQDYATGQVELLLPNLSGPLRDVRMRQAVACAIDRQDLIANTYQSHGVAIESPVTPDSWLSERTEAQVRDLNRARKLLGDLGWRDISGKGKMERHTTRPVIPAGEPSETEPLPSQAVSLLDPPATPTTLPSVEALTLKLVTNEEEGASRKDAASRIASQLAEAGITVEVETMTFDALLERLGTDTYDLALVGYQLPSTGDLRQLLHSQGANNKNGYADAALDTLFDQLNTVTTEDAYLAAMQGIHAHVIEQLPVIPLLMRSKTQVRNPFLTIPAPVRAGEPFRGIEAWSYLPA